MRRTRLIVGVTMLLVAVSVGAAALLLNGTDNSAQISAAQACDLMDTPYDALATASVPGEEWRWETRYSGPDRHVVITTIGSDGTLIGKADEIIKDRTRYARASTPGNPEVYGEWRVHGTDVPRSFSIPCLDTSSFDEGASGTSDEPHFTSERFLSEEEGAMRNEYWADSTGRPTRARRTIFPPEYDGVTNTETGVMEFTYSEYGEPNIIEAPCASAAPHQADNPGLMRDCINLLAAKDALRGTATLNWSVDTTISDWDGVKVSGSPGRVTELNLTSESLTGTIPPVLGRLDGLEYLRLVNNQLTGEIPAELGNLPNLRIILASDNQLTGAIPRELGNLFSLEELWLHRNRLSGEIPATLGDLSDLRDLLLSENRLSGAIPSELGDLSKLEELKLSYNQLTGEIPAALGDLGNLTDLLLGNNELTGCIPPALRDVEDHDLTDLGLQDCATP